MVAVKSPLSDEQRKPVGMALQGALVDLIDLSLLAKQAHWNLIGKHFRSLHLQLDEIVDLARNHMDIMAERAIAIGVNPDGRASTVANQSRVPQLDAGYIADDKVVAAFIDILESINGRFRERITATETADPVTQDLLINVAEDLEKQHWMIQAQA
jgi:starvation-inducible DNA-binding protein